jgi:hypothetical protein
MRVRVLFLTCPTRRDASQLCRQVGTVQSRPLPRLLRCPQPLPRRRRLCRLPVAGNGMSDTTRHGHRHCICISLHTKERTYKWPHHGFDAGGFQCHRDTGVVVGCGRTVINLQASLAQQVLRHSQHEVSIAGVCGLRGLRAHRAPRGECGIEHLNRRSGVVHARRTIRGAQHVRPEWPVRPPRRHHRNIELLLHRHSTHICLYHQPECIQVCVPHACGDCSHHIRVAGALWPLLQLHSMGQKRSLGMMSCCETMWQKLPPHRSRRMALDRASFPSSGLPKVTHRAGGAEAHVELEDNMQR